MIAAKIENARNALSILAGTVPEEIWQLVKAVQAELDDAAVAAGQLETTLVDARSTGVTTE